MKYSEIEVMQLVLNWASTKRMTVPMGMTFADAMTRDPRVTWNCIGSWWFGTEKWRKKPARFWFMSLILINHWYEITYFIIVHDYYILLYMIHDRECSSNYWPNIWVHRFMFLIYSPWTSLTVALGHEFYYEVSTRGVMKPKFHVVWDRKRSWRLTR